jgi:hypothetical protein
MAENRSRLRGMPEPFTLSFQPSDKTQRLVAGEANLLEMIATDARLTSILDELCSALDAQIGKVTSMISLAGEDEEVERVAPRATQFGFSLFYSSEIVSRDEFLLGNLEMYCCVPRTPTAGDIALIERAVLIAARAIQRDDWEEESDRLASANKKRGKRPYILPWSLN